MNENNTKVITTTTNDNMITITLAYGPQQNAATEKPEITPEVLDEMAHEAGYLTKEEAEDLISEARQNALSEAGNDEFEYEANDRGYFTIEEALRYADDYDFYEEADKRGYTGEEDVKSAIEEARQNALGDADEEEFGVEANYRGYYKPRRDDDELNEAGYYMIEDALEKVEDYDFEQEAEDLISEARQNALSDADEEEFGVEANDRGYYRQDQILDNADMDELIEAINSRLGSKLMTEEGWREQATEDGWMSPEQVAQTIADKISELKNQIATLLQNEQLSYLQNA